MHSQSSNTSRSEVTLTEEEFWETVEVINATDNPDRSLLPNAVRDLPLDQLRMIATLIHCVTFDESPNTDSWDTGRLPLKPELEYFCLEAGALRKERDFTGFGLRAAPYLHSTTDGGWELYVKSKVFDLNVCIFINDQKFKHLSPKAYSEKYDPRVLDTIIPARHRKMSLWNLSPVIFGTEDAPTLSLDQYQTHIEMTKNLNEKTLHGWVILGPGGLGKTTLQSVWLKDVITFRVVSSPGAELCVWRVDAGPWLDSVEDWYSTPYAGRDEANRPLLPDIITRAAKDSPYRPILFIEEMQGMDLPSPKRLKWLHSLLDAVYQEDGLIVANANWTADELKASIPNDATRRRLTGEGEPEDRQEQFEVWDFYEAVEHNRRILEKSKRRGKAA